MPICLAVSAGLMVAQESDLRTTPISTIVTKIYGARDEVATLAVFGIDTSSVREFPSFQNQLALVRTEAPKLVSNALGTDVDVSVNRTEPRVSMLATDDGDGKQLFTVSSNEIANYGFACTAPERAICDEAIDIYVKSVELVRKDGLINGLNQLSGRISAALESISTPQPELELQLNVINSTIRAVSGQLEFVSETTETTGGTVSTVKFSTYIFGLAVGLIVAILIMLQLTVTDDKIRSSKRLRGLDASLPYLGEIRKESVIVDSAHVAAAIIIRARSSNSTRVVLMPIGTNTSTAASLISLRSTETSTEIELSSGNSVESMSVDDLVNNDATFVLVVDKTASTAGELTETFEVLRRTGNVVLGAMLTSK